MAFEVDLSTLEFLLGNGASPNAVLPGSDKSVWYDFLLSLRTDFPNQHRDLAWDMTPTLILHDFLHGTQTATTMRATRTKVLETRSLKLRGFQIGTKHARS